MQSLAVEGVAFLISPIERSPPFNKMFSTDVRNLFAALYPDALASCPDASAMGTFLTSMAHQGLVCRLDGKKNAYSSLLEATPVMLKDAADMRRLHIARGEPVISDDFPGMEAHLRLLRPAQEVHSSRVAQARN